MCALLGVAAGSRAAVAVDDPRLDDQWGLDKIGAPEAWSRGTANGSVIAVVDTGIDLQHEDLRDKIVAHVNCIGADDDPSQCQGSGQDDHGHGTHVAGIAAAATDNGLGVAGTAPKAEIMAVKVLEPDPTGDASGSMGDVRAGIRYAVDHGADVVNLSLGENVLIRGLLGSGLSDAVEYAWEHGVIAVVAAGNSTSLFGSGYQGVKAMVATATTVDDEQASYATDIGGATWGIAAPGGESTDTPATKILSTWWRPSTTNAYGWLAGTSMATPFVSGGAAVLLALGLSPQQTVDRLLQTAVDLGPPGVDDTFGYGRLDLAAATAGLGEADEVIEPPPPTPTTPEPNPPSPPPVRVQARTAVVPATPATAASPPPGTAPTTAPEAPDIAPATEAAGAPPETSDNSTGSAPWIIVAAGALAVSAGAVRRVARRRGPVPG